MKSFLFMLSLMAPLGAELTPFSTYVGVGYRQDTLELKYASQDNSLPLCQVKFQPVQAAELRFGGRYQPRDLFQTSARASGGMFNHLALFVEGAVILNACPGKCQLNFGEGLCTSEGRQQKGALQKAYGGDFSIGLAYNQPIGQSSLLSFSLGYAAQDRSYSLRPKSTRGIDETIFDIQKMHTHALWHGPFVGIGALQHLNCAWSLFANIEYQRTFLKEQTQLISEERFSDDFYLHSRSKWSQSNYINYFKALVGAAYTLDTSWTLALVIKSEFFNGNCDKIHSQSNDRLYAPWRQIGHVSKHGQGKLSTSWHSLAISGNINYAY